jgi:AAA domain
MFRLDRCCRCLAAENIRVAKVTVIVGLPGAGKTHLVRQLSESYPGVCEEDYHAHANNHSPLVTASRHYPRLIAALRAGQDCAIADIAFTCSWRRFELEQVLRSDVADVVVDWVYFANELEKCIANIRRRARPNQSEEISLARRLSPCYFVPQGVAVTPVWEPTPESPDI